MKIAVLIARILLGLVFFVFGLNKFLMFIPMGPLPTGLAGQFITALFQSHYIDAVAIFEIVGGALLLVNRFVPLGLVLLGPVLVNVVLFHSFMEPSGLPLAAVLVALWLFVAYNARKHFTGIFAQKVDA